MAKNGGDLVFGRNRLLLVNIDPEELGMRKGGSEGGILWGNHLDGLV